MVDPRITQAFEDGRVKEEGITPEFLAESKDQPAIIAIIFVTALTFSIVCTRLLSRIFIVKRFGFDDALALCGLVCILLRRLVVLSSEDHSLIECFFRYA